jgi:hypothetical protein
MTTTYVPQPGSLPARAIAWLQAQPQGTEVTSSRWAEQIGADVTKLILAMQTAVDKGAVLRFTKHGQTKPYFYRLPGEQKRSGAWTAPSAADDVEDDEAGAMVQRVVPAASCKAEIPDDPLAAMFRKSDALASGGELGRKPGGPSHWRANPLPMMEHTKGDQPRFERGREGMEPEACESATGRGTTGAPALATLPHTSTAPRDGSSGEEGLLQGTGRVMTAPAALDDIAILLKVPCRTLHEAERVMQFVRQLRGGA